MDATSLAELRATAATTDAIVAHSNDLIMFFRADGTISWVTPVCRRMFGVEPDELTGRLGLDLVHPDDRARVAAEFERLTALGDQVRTEFRVLTPGGEERWVEEVATNLLDEPNVGAVVGNLRDITDRKRAEEAAAALSSIVESSRDAIISTTLDGRIKTWNGGAAELYGRRAEEMVGRDICTLFTRGGGAALRTLLQEIPRGGLTDSVETVALRSDGSTAHVSVSISPLRDSRGEVVGAAAIARDVSEQVRLRERIEDDRRRLADAQSSARLGSFEIDLATGEVTRSDELYRILGLPPGSLHGVDFDHIHPDDRDEVHLALAEAASTGGEVEVTHRITRPDGEIRWVTSRSSRFHDPSTGILAGTMLDITERYEAELALAHQATHDVLTGLPNRACLSDTLRDHLDGRAGTARSVAVAFLDLDQFKVINDSLGHEMGDQALLAVAQRLTDGLPPTDIVGRFGGDEFLLLRPGARTLDDARALAEEAAAILEAPLLLAGQSFPLSASIGVALSEGAEGAEALFRDADAAMYLSKEGGRARITVFDETARAHVHRRATLESDLRRAVADDELQLAYQPMVRLASGSVVGFEALLRWTHPRLGPIWPGEIVPIAESSGLIDALGDWVLARAVRQLAEWRRRGDVDDETWVAVNLSARQLGRPRLVDSVTEALAASDLPARILHLEITESMLMERVEHSSATLARLKELGVRVSIDDFGTGYSSLSYLSHLPLDTLKIDRSFVARLTTGGPDASIVRAILGLADNLGLDVVAEGIERPEQLEHLRALGCGYGQGFLWTPALPPEEASRWAVDERRRSELAART